MTLAEQKLNGQRRSFFLSLLSYRLSFHVVNTALAEDLVSGWLRYINPVNPY